MPKLTEEDFFGGQRLENVSIVRGAFKAAGAKKQATASGAAPQKPAAATQRTPSTYRGYD